MREPDRRRVAVALALVALLAVVPPLADARPANQIPLGDFAGTDAPLDDPTAEAWGRTPAAEVALSSAPSGLPNADSVATERVSVKAARTGETLYVRLSWTDESADRNVTGPRSFADAAAVQMPVNTSAQPAIAMGSSRQLVNIWYWDAATGGEELLAGGAGTTTRFRQPLVATSAVHRNGTWTVVFARPLEAGAANRTSVGSEHDLAVAFAVWNGANMERSGRKAVSEWYYLATGPGPQGPPYESILWAVAGLAVLVVVAATVHAVRET